MRIASFLQVIDDIDALTANIQYHRSIGVDYFLICDRGASGEDLDRLMALTEQDGIRVFRMNVQQIEQVDKQTLPNHRLNAYQRVFTEFEPDWALFSDVDEFWVPKSGNLSTIPSLSNSDLLTVPRFNAALELGVEEPLIGSVLNYENVATQEVVAQPLAYDGQALIDNPNARWIMHAVGAKMMSRVRNVDNVLQGFHDIQCNTEIRRATPDDLAIVHYPFTSLERFTDKVENIRAHLRKTASTFAPGSALHWRRWMNQLTDQQAISEEYDRQFFTPEALISLRKQNVVRTALEIMEDIN